MDDYHTHRIAEFDFFKGVAIILVVCGHVILFNWEDALIKHPVYTWIYSFHMPLFFFISGYLLRYVSNNRPPYLTIVKRFLSLMIPYIIWRVVIIPILTSQNIPSMEELFANVDGRYWFLYFLFTFSALFVAGVSVTKPLGKFNCLGGAVFMMSVMCGCNYIFPCTLFTRGFQFVPLYIMGVLAYEYKIISKRRAFNDNIMLFVVVFFILASVSYCQIASGEISKIIKFGASSMSSYIVLCVISRKLFVENKITRVIQYIGRSSIVIYVTHFLFVRILPDAFVPINLITPFWSFMLAMTISIIIISACIVIGICAEKFVWVDRLFFGRGWKLQKIR